MEILSPGDTLRRAFEKAKHYLSWGTECVWIIDPEKRTAWMCSREATEPAWVNPDGDLRIGATAIAVAAVFEEVDRAESA